MGGGMSSVQNILRESEDRMKKTLDATNQSVSSIRTGRANSGMVENLRVDYYGAMTPLKQMANITVPEPRLLMISPWDVSALKAIEKAVMDSDLGVTPVIDGKLIRISIPPLTRERREELVKIVHKLAEEGHVSMRSNRREGNEKIKVLSKEKKITEDESFKAEQDMQKLTDRYIQMIDQAQAAKVVSHGSGCQRDCDIGCSGD